MAIISSEARPIIRRSLKFSSIDEALAEAERLVQAEKEGRLKRAGNWTLGQTLGHLAAWASFAFDGYPEVVRPPALLRLILRLMRNRVINKGMMPGVKFGRAPGGTVATDVISAEEGLNRFRAAMKKLADNAPTMVSPAFGKLTHEQWINLNLRHAELHLSFQVPG